jgi:hypothetical protein
MDQLRHTTSITISTWPGHQSPAQPVTRVITLIRMAERCPASSIIDHQDEPVQLLISSAHHRHLIINITEDEHARVCRFGLSLAHSIRLLDHDHICPARAFPAPILPLDLRCTAHSVTVARDQRQAHTAAAGHAAGTNQCSPGAQWTHHSRHRSLAGTRGSQWQP